VAETLDINNIYGNQQAKRDKRSSLSLIRYADDFVILHEVITVVQRCQEVISEWLKDVGLELKPSKTRLAHTLIQHEQEKPGFDFLGYNIHQYHTGKYSSKQGFKTIITPSKEKQKVHYDQIASVIDAHKSAPQASLIARLNPIIRGWANYYATVVSKQVYSKLDELMYKKLAAWATRRHPQKGEKWVAKKYWHSIGDNNWAFAVKKDKSYLQLLEHDDTPIVRHVKVKGESSPFDGNLVYWSSRMGKNPELPNRVAKLMKKQSGKCAYCELFFREDDVMEVDHIIPKSQGGKDEYKNLQLLHRHCHDTKTSSDGSPGIKSGCNSAKPKPTESEIRDTLAPLKRLVLEVGKWVTRWV